MKVRSLFAVAGAAGLLAAGTAAATAAAPFNVVGGGAFTATAAPISFSVPTSPMSCAQVDAEGTIFSGSTSGNPGGNTHVGDIDSTDWQGCLGPLNLPMTVNQIGTWQVHIDAGESPTSAATDVLSGSIQNVEAYVYQTSSEGSCNFTVEGSAEGTFDEAGQLLSIDEANSNLTVTAVTGCYGRVLVNQNANFQGDFDVDAATPVNVTP